MGKRSRDLEDRLRETWLQFFGEHLVITAMFSVHKDKAIREHFHERALEEAEEKRASQLPEAYSSRIETKLASLLPRIVNEGFPLLSRRTTVVMVVSSFEVYLVDCITHVLRHRPDLIAVKLKQKKVTKLSIPVKVREAKISQQVRALPSMKNKLDFIMREPLGVDARFPPSKETDIIEIDATRNLIVHGGTVVNQRYLDAVNRSEFKIGSERPIDDA